MPPAAAFLLGLLVLGPALTIAVTTVRWRRKQRRRANNYWNARPEKALAAARLRTLERRELAIERAVWERDLRAS